MNAVVEKEQLKKKAGWKARLYWFAYIVILAISIPHMAYAFEAYSENTLFGWILSIAGAGLIDASMYNATWSMYQLVRSGMTWKKFGANVFLFLWILICVTVSWWANSIHNAHFQNNSMLTGTENIPFITVFGYAAGAWPLFMVIFSLTSNIATTDFVDHGPIETRTAEEILEDGRKKEAVLIAEANLKKTLARIRGGQVRESLKSGVGSLIGGTLDGIREGIQQPKEEVETIPAPQEEVHEEQYYIAPPAAEPIIHHEPEPIRILSDVEKLSIVQTALESHPYISAAEIANLIGSTSERIGAYWLSQARVISQEQKQQTIVAEVNEEREKDTPAEVEAVMIKPLYKTIDANSVGYSNTKPYFTNSKGAVFASIGTAYQNTKNIIYRADLADPRITKESLKRLIDEQKLSPSFVRLVKIQNPFTKAEAIAYTVAVHEQIQRKILDLL